MSAGPRTDFYASFAGLRFSALGIGTYLGAPTDACDASYASSVLAAVQGGVTVIDTAANYRFQRGERAVGAALKQLHTAGVSRESLVICTKGGYLAFDGAVPADPRAYFEETFVRPGIAGYEDLIQGNHCMAPRYLEHQITQSLHNLGVSKLDVYYLHNPETQLNVLSVAGFHRRLRAAFEQLEHEVAAGRIANYGVATWNGFRARDIEPGYLSLHEIVRLAEEVAPAGHHFRYVQLPLNPAMTEALELPNQEGMTFLEAARALQIGVVASASLFQAKVLGRLKPGFREAAGAANDALAALQLARSAPGVFTALAGMSRVEHVTANLALAALPKLDPQQLERLLAQL